MPSSSTATATEKLPTRIGVGVRVVERKNGGRIGTVIEAGGKRVWKVQFDGADELENKSSIGALKIHKEAYGVQESTPSSKAAPTVCAAVPKTGRRDDGNAHSDQSSSSSESDENEVDSSFAASASTTDSDNNATTPNQNKKRPKKKIDAFAAAKKSLPKAARKALKKTTRQMNNLLSTPRTPTDSDDDGSDISSFGGGDSSADTANVFIPAEDEGFDDEMEMDEDDDCRGDPKQFQDDHGSRTEFIDCPQRRDLYDAAKKRMEEEKEKLIAEEEIVYVEIKSKRKYEFGARVRGRKNTGRFNKYGTITDVLNPKRYEILW